MNGESEQDWIDSIVRYLGPFALGTILMASVNVAVLQVLVDNYPNAEWMYLRVCVHPLIAAIQEPITSKFLPAIGVLLWAKRESRESSLQSRKLRFAVLGGTTVGSLEAGSRILDSLSLKFSVLPPVAMHASTGLIIGVAVYRLAGQQSNVVDYSLVVGAYSLALTIHFFWNSRVAFWLANTPPC